MIGTVLPTSESLKSTEAYARRVAADKMKAAALHFAGIEPRRMGGEDRYYFGAFHYGIIGRDMLPRWFHSVAAGDYSCPDPRTK